MKLMSSNEIRSIFLKFFKKNDHHILPSSPLVPENDPTLLFTNAGMVQFKDNFLNGRPEGERVATSQKCIRAGGKHNDLENVGYTARHHTFFEMLGNFSFGDYFKEEACEYAWNLLTRDLGLPPSKLYITVYHDDEETFKIWKKMTGFGDDKIIKIATQDNFWSMGNTGPCGPCTEIFFDHGENVSGGLPGTPEENGDRFTEIWNLVFTQFNKMEDGSLKPLERKCIDTGMGLERISAILQKVHNNYDIDVFKNLISGIVSLTGTGNKNDSITAHRIIADHLRSSSFLIADGVMPSNEGRGYVLRRIIRRAVRYVHKIGYNDKLLHKIFPILLTEMKEAYPELERAQDLVKEVLSSEEDSFRDTLDRGLNILGQPPKWIKDLKQAFDLPIKNLNDRGGQPKFNEGLQQFSESCSTFHSLLYKIPQDDDQAGKEEYERTLTKAKNGNLLNTYSINKATGYNKTDDFMPIMRGELGESLNQVIEEGKKSESYNETSHKHLLYSSALKKIQDTCRDIINISIIWHQEVLEGIWNFLNMNGLGDFSSGNVWFDEMMKRQKEDRLLYCLLNKTTDEFIEILIIVIERYKSMGGSYEQIGEKLEKLIAILDQDNIKNFVNNLNDYRKDLDESTALNGKTAFLLYDTYGFPLDLTIDIMKEHQMTVNVDGFNVEMEKQKDRARKAWKGSGDVKKDEIWREIEEEFGSTTFIRTHEPEISAKILAIVHNGQRLKNLDSNTIQSDIILVLDQTNFYAESGGQVADTGTIEIKSDIFIHVTDVRKSGDLHLHYCKITNDASIAAYDIATEQEVKCKIDATRRKKIAVNHTATHLLHSALRETLGKHVTQKGSLVNADSLRFDFSHYHSLSKDDLLKVESLVNQYIEFGTEVITEELNKDEAVKKGAMALFGEKYADKVRVVSVGYESLNNTKNSNIPREICSIELCGGTHVQHANQIGVFKIIKEGSIASGIRRITGITGYTKYSQYFNDELSSLHTSIEELDTENKKLKTEVATLKKNIAKSIKPDEYIIAEHKLLTVHFGDISAKETRSLAIDYKNKHSDYIIIITSYQNEKGIIILITPDNLLNEINTFEIVDIGARVIDGRCKGGKPEFIQAGGSNIKKITDVIPSMIDAIKSKLS